MIFTGNYESDDLAHEENISDYCLMNGDVRYDTEQEFLRIRERWFAERRRQL